jgi:hypothetical protein
MSAIKTWSSCIRNPAFRQRLEHNWHLRTTNPAPREGDLVVVRALADAGAYTVVENVHGREVRIYLGDEFVGILGTRRSGRNPTGVLPDWQLRSGDVLDLVAVGGLIAKATFTPRYYGGKALPVEIVGFPTLRQGRIANIRDGCRLSAPSRPIANGRVLFVLGTSAEAGKTTFLCEAVRSVQRWRGDLRVGAIKACGTGRLRDPLRYADSGAQVTVDFVEAGWPTTYNIPAAEFTAMLDQLIGLCQSRTDITFIEVGGDLLEACAPEAIAIAVELRAPAVLCVNDAIGAAAGMRQLTDARLQSVMICSMNQNQMALAERLRVEHVVDPQAPSDIDFALARLLPAITEGAERPTALLR